MQAAAVSIVAWTPGLTHTEHREPIDLGHPLLPSLLHSDFTPVSADGIDAGRYGVRCYLEEDASEIGLVRPSGVLVRRTISTRPPTPPARQAWSGQLRTSLDNKKGVLL